KRKDRRQVDTDQLLFSRVFYYVSQVLNVPTPEVYLQPERPGDISLFSIDEKGSLIPAVVVRAGMLQGRPEKEIVFAWDKGLANMRRDHYLKKAWMPNPEQKIAFISAMVLVQRTSPVKPQQQEGVHMYLPHLNAKMQPAWREQLHGVVKRFLQNATQV